MAKGVDLTTKFGTKTAYRAPSVSAPLPQCTLLSVNAVLRHGSRYPTSSTLRHLTALSSLVNETAQAGRWLPAWSWSVPYSADNAGHLCSRGDVEMHDIGERLGARYASLLAPERYNPTHVSIVTTHKPRTSQSATSFALGLLHGRGAFAVHTDTMPLRPFDRCARYQAAMASYGREQDVFLKAVIPKIADSLSARTGIPRNRIGTAEVFAMWNAAQYEHVVENSTERWLTLFDEADAEQLEFAEDLLSYYKKGRGRELSYKVMTPLLEDIWDTVVAMLDKNTSSDHYYKARLRFAHAETLLPLLALLDIATESSDMKADWSESEMSRRVWRDSMLAPFSANLVIALYDCGAERGLVFETLLNERQVMLPGCSKVLCPFEEFAKIVEAALDDEEDSWEYRCKLKKQSKKIKKKNSAETKGEE